MMSTMIFQYRLGNTPFLYPLLCHNNYEECFFHEKSHQFQPKSIMPVVILQFKNKLVFKFFHYDFSVNCLLLPDRLLFALLWEIRVNINLAMCELSQFVMEHKIEIQLGFFKQHQLMYRNMIIKKKKSDIEFVIYHCLGSGA